jgi:glycosyltransferase involved in cell wall biosynthesis
VKLAVNGWRLAGKRTGIGRYVMNIVQHWTPEMVAGRFSDIALYTTKPLSTDITLPQGVRHRTLGPDWRLILWENVRLGPAVDEGVMFCPAYTRPILTRSRTVVTTHDALPKLYPELFPRSIHFYNALYGWSARAATLVITDSAAARDDIVRCWDVPESKIRVVYMGAADAFRPVDDEAALSAARRRYLGEDVPFYLFVGKISGRRNIPLLLEAYAELKRRTPLPHKLLLVGLNIHNVPIDGMIASLGLRDHVRHVPFVDDGDLNLLYNAAETFVMPSTYETVNLPVLEAQAAGTPVICIGSAGMRETSGGAARFVPSMTADDLREAMDELARDPVQRQELAARGRENVAHFSWRQCAADTLAVLDEAAVRDPR